MNGADDRRASYVRGYSSFFCAPGTVQSVMCAVCGTECAVERNRLCAGSFTEHMAGHKSLYDYFRCDAAGEIWHQCLTHLVSNGVIAHAQDVSIAREPTVCQADEVRSAELARQGDEAAAAGDIYGAISLYERAAALDQYGVLNADYWGKRAVLFAEERGDDRQVAAILRYGEGYKHSLRGDYYEAMACYANAADWDRKFLWPINNLGWLFATYRKPEARSGIAAVRVARHACEASLWRCPSFVGTLAAAYARNGDFELAVHFARAALPFTRDSYRPYAERELACYEARSAFVDDGSAPVAAGDDVPEGGNDLQ